MNVIESKIQEYESMKEAASSKLMSVEKEAEGLRSDIARYVIQIDTLKDVMGQSFVLSSDSSQIPPTVKQAVADFVKNSNQRTFTKDDLLTSLRQLYPSLEFTDRAIEKPLSALVEEGEAIMVRRGNAKFASVYCSKQKQAL